MLKIFRVTIVLYFRTVNVNDNNNDDADDNDDNDRYDYHHHRDHFTPFVKSILLLSFTLHCILSICPPIAGGQLMRPFIVYGKIYCLMNSSKFLIFEL